MRYNTNLSSYLNRNVVETAKDLLGCLLEIELDGKTILVKIVETEAYDQNDVASHSYNGVTPRTEIMFGPAGFLYVYFTYGMHYCCNIVVGEEGHGAAVLIRAVEPLSGIETLRKRRSAKTDTELTNGPAKLCQALGIDKQLNKHDLTKPPVKLVIKPPVNDADVLQTTRIGISKGKELPWRFYIKGNSYVSRSS